MPWEYMFLKRLRIHTQVKRFRESTLATFTAKFLFALTFIVPVMILDLSNAIIVGIAWGMLMLAILSRTIAKIDKKNPWKVVVEHLTIALMVVVLAHYCGLIAETFS